MTHEAEKAGDNEKRWESGWDGHEIAQLRRMAALSLEEKIRWLESAQKMVQQMRGSQPGTTQNTDITSNGKTMENR